MSQPTSLLAGLAKDVSLLEAIGVLQQLISSGSPDASPPLISIAPGGVSITADAASHPAVPSTIGRLLVEITHAGSSGRMWLGFGTVAQPNKGMWLDPGQSYAQMYNGAVNVAIVGTGVAQLCTWQEWSS